MPDIVLKALYFFLQVLLYAGTWFVAWVSILGVIVLYRKMKKEADKEKRKLDEIIVKRNEEKDKADKEIQSKTEELKKIDDEILAKKMELGQIAAEKSQPDVIVTPEVTKPEEAVKPEEVKPTPRKKQAGTKKPKS